MRPRGVMPAALLLLLCVSVVRAGNPWQDKPSQDWTEKDVKKVLLDSPWVNKVWLGRPDLTGDDASPVNSRGLNRNQAENEGVLAEAGGPPMRQPTTEGRPEDPPSRGTTSVGRSSAGRVQLIVRWFSARTIGEALIRHWQMQSEALAQKGASTETMRQELGRNILQMENRLSQSRPNYEIVVSPMFLSEPNRKDLASETFLQPQRAKNKIPPERIEFRGESMVFYFPRELDGQPTIGPEEKKVRFETRVHGRRIRTDFNLSEMKRESRPDL